VREEITVSRKPGGCCISRCPASLRFYRGSCARFPKASVKGVGLCGAAIMFLDISVRGGAECANYYSTGDDDDDDS
jgi:hypothetical protein